MKLTADTLKNFWIWYLLPEQRKTYKTSSLRGVDNVAKIRFLAMSFTERYGVLEDFFDSVGIRISIRNIGDSYWYVTKYPNREGLTDKHESKFMSRPEARTSAIEKANEIYNLNQQIMKRKTFEELDQLKELLRVLRVN